MARKKASKASKTKTTTRRGSPEAVQKRRTARQLNTLLTGGPVVGVDRRTERRRRRLLEELAKGRGGEALKPITVLTHADELLAIDTPLAEVRKAAGKKYKATVTDEILEVAARAQAAYGFDLRVWPLLGIDLDSAKASKPSRKKSRS